MRKDVIFPDYKLYSSCDRNNFFYNKIVNLKRPKTVKKVMLANSASGCCNNTDFSVDNCTNRYCFKKNLWQIVQAIEQSQHSICLALYTLNLSDVKKALKDVYRRGVQIRIITTAASMKNLSGDFPQLSNAGVSIRFPKDEDQLFHHKFCIVDGQKPDKQQSVPDGALLLTGSMNWTINSFTSNWDIATSDEEWIEKFQVEFDSLWQKFQRSQNK